MGNCLKNIFITRKERTPITTVRIIRDELNTWKIRTKIVKILKTKQFYSVRLELRDLPGVGVNGKGISLMYALASAYSEFMERFLSGFLVKSSFFNKDRSVFLFSDEDIVDYEMFYRKWKTNVENNLFPNITHKEVLWDTVKRNGRFRKQAPFNNLITRKRESLPIALINFVTHTNGLCAGNSREEALVQGICEIFERYCYRKIVTEKISAPIIDIGDALEDKLGWLKERGYSYEIRDFSLGVFPVVGLVVYDKEGSYQINAGADPILEIAIQRCMTELFQGLSEKNLKEKLKFKDNMYDRYEKKYGKSFVNANWMKCYTSNNGMVSSVFFKRTTTISTECLPFIANGTNRGCLKYLLDLCKEEGLEVYAKDYSRGDFRTYRVYIPGMSEIDLLDDNDFHLNLLYEELKEVYFNPLKIERIIMEYYYCSHNVRNLILQNASNCFNANNYALSPYFELDFKELFILSAYISGEQEQLKDYLVENEDAKGVKRYSQNLSLKGVEKELTRLLIYLQPPNCPNCPKCYLRRKCKYDEWRKIMDAIYQ